MTRRDKCLAHLRVATNLVFFALLLICCLTVFDAIADTQSIYKEGEDYRLISPPIKTTKSVKGKVEVAEAYWYGCPACYRAKPVIKDWVNEHKEKVTFRALPVLFFGDESKTHAALYYVNQKIGNDALDDKIFNSIHVENNRLNNNKRIVEFFNENGVKTDVVTKELKSFSTKNNIRKANALVKAAGITGVPALIINGKYTVSLTRQENSLEHMLNVAEYLIEKEQSESRTKT